MFGRFADDDREGCPRGSEFWVELEILRRKTNIEVLGITLKELFVLGRT